MTDPIYREYGINSGVVIDKEELEEWGEYECEAVSAGKSVYYELFYHEYEPSYTLTLKDNETKDKIMIYVKNFTYDYYNIGDTFNLYQGISTEPIYKTRTTTENEKKTQKAC
ncbi:hypothetical protein ACQKNX_07780 [Lysinibacillus sp. NPDC093712]|uniref:hypothetical protein n=1 Tax=Lysinibacillus sp. NPDC093712 TaxID=3390579 RepID=UPI003D01947A